MKSNIMKIFVITAIMIFIGAGASFADDRGHHRGHACGHYKHKVHHHYPMTKLLPGLLEQARVAEQALKALLIERT